MKRIFPLAAMLVLGGTVRLVALDVMALDGRGLDKVAATAAIRGGSFQDHLICNLES